MLKIPAKSTLANTVLPAPAQVDRPRPEGFDLLMASLSSDNHIKGRQFEEISAWILREAPLYRNQLKQVWRWADFPYRKGIDDGIDLVAETHDGKFWAIQCKGYAPEYSIKKSDLDSFISAAGKTFEVGTTKRSFDYRLLIASTDSLGTTAERCLDNQEKPVGRLLRSDIKRIEEDGLSFPSDIQALSHTETVPPIFPHPHQERAVTDVCAGLIKHDRGQLISACGTGKTLEALWVAERLKAQKIIVACPSLGLIAQTLKAWNANASQPFDFKVVCSDETVVGNALENRVERASELGVPVTTDPKEVEAFLSSKHPGRSVLFTTYQSLPVVTEAQRKLKHSFDLGIADEAHYCAGSGKGLFSRFLHESEVKIDKRLFMTATPRIYSEASTKRIEGLGLTCVDMDDEKLFGPVLHKFTLREAIDQNLLSDYRVVVLGVKQGELESLLNSSLEFLTEKGRRVDAGTLTAQIALLKAAEKYGITRTISFHSSVARAQSFVSALPEIAEHLNHAEESPWVSHVNGEMRASNRSRILEQFASNKDTLSLVSNCACLGEGIDVPNLDCVAFIDPRGSSVDVVQNVGRVVRKSSGKTAGTILIPVFMKDGEDADSLLASSRFSAVYETLRALRSHVPKLAAALDAARSNGSGGLIFKEGFVSEKVVIDLDPELPGRISDAICARIVDKVSMRQPLSEEIIIEWAKAWNRKHNGKWPTAISGPIGEDVAPGESWGSADAALSKGFRGLHGGSSLADLLERHNLKRNQLKLPTITEEQIVEWAIAWNRKYSGQWPVPSSGPIGEDIAPGETWGAVHSALRQGFRGLHGGSSLADLLERYDLRRNRMNLPHLTEAQIVTWAKYWNRKHNGKWPIASSGPIGEDIAPGETWGALHSALSQGFRGLHGGSSLADLLERHNLKRNQLKLPTITEEQIVKWAKEWSQKHNGKWPTRSSGPIGEDIAPGESWEAVASALSKGSRGLPGGSSLPGLLERHNLKRNRINRPPLTEAQIVTWATAWSRNNNGQRPTQLSGMIGKDIAPGETWGAVDAALFRGSRGLPGGSSLADLLERHGLKRNRLNLPPITEK